MFMITWLRQKQLSKKLSLLLAFPVTISGRGSWFSFYVIYTSDNLALAQTVSRDTQWERIQRVAVFFHALDRNKKSNGGLVQIDQTCATFSSRECQMLQDGRASLCRYSFNVDEPIWERFFSSCLDEEERKSIETNGILAWRSSQ